MGEPACSGACCAVFWLPADPNTDWSKIRDGEFIADMIVRLTRDQAKERWAKFVGSHDLPPAQEGRTTFTCRHWDEETRLCREYERRPAMCRDYPYGKGCSHGCSYEIADPERIATYAATESPK